MLRDRGKIDRLFYILYFCLHMKFSQYHISDKIKKNLTELGFLKPTDIQYKSIPSIMKGEDVLAIAQTGTGKTAAFAIPIVDRLFAKKRHRENKSIRCLVMVPTRELAVQINEVFSKIAANTPLKILTTFGGADQTTQIKALKTGIDILISTPGRMFDLRSQGYIDLSETEVLILDEADHMLALGFIKDIQDVIKHLPRRYQTLFFSATIDEKIKDLAYSIVRNPIRIQLSPKDPVSKNIDHQVAYIEMDDKRFFLERMIREKEESKMLVFVRTKVRAERLAKAMERVNIKTLTMHGDKHQEDRLEVMETFRKGDIRVLIATDISARGIDIPGIHYVINYDLPDVAENYVHRIGRTGRGTERGHALTFCAPEEKPILEIIQGFLGKEIRQMEIDKSDYRMTLALTEEVNTNWQKLLDEAATAKSSKRKKKKK